MNTTRAIIAASFLLAGCGADGPVEQQEQEQSQAQAPIVEGSPEAAGVVRFANETTLSVLDDEVPLPSNAAFNVIAHRDGPDALPGSRDDNLFDDVAEILSVKQIGQKRLEAMVAYANSQGYVPSGDDVLGEYDDVTFTVAQAEATLLLANDAGEATLDDDLGLDRRAVTSILDARPIASVLALSELYYVGKSALTKLRDHAAPISLAGEGDDCADTAACESGLTCYGIPHDGSLQIGKCVDLGNVSGHGDDCGHHIGGCNEGLSCSGTTVYGGQGYCRPLWMFGSFENKTTVAIPDADAGGASLDVVVYGLATVPEDIMVRLWIDHPRPSDLVVTLSHTNGSSDVLWNHDASPDLYLPSLGIERDNTVNGRFTLHVADTVAGESGTLDGVKLVVSSRFD